MELYAFCVYIQFKFKMEMYLFMYILYQVQCYT